MENTFVTGDKILIVIEILVLDFLVFLGFNLLYMIVYEDAIQNLIIQLFLWFLFLFFYNSIVTIGEEKWGLEP